MSLALILNLGVRDWNLRCAVATCLCPAAPLSVLPRGLPLLRTPGPGRQIDIDELRAQPLSSASGHGFFENTPAQKRTLFNDHFRGLSKPHLRQNSCTNSCNYRNHNHPQPGLLEGTSFNWFRLTAQVEHHSREHKP